MIMAGDRKITPCRFGSGASIRCHNCREPIPDERLEAGPAAGLTVDEARANERG